MLKNFWRLGILALCLAACGQATPAPTATSPLPTNTAVVLPTATGTPTAAPTRTATKTLPPPTATRTSRPTNSPTPTYPPLPPQGPYLLADVGTWEKHRLVILGAEQGGRKELVLPDNGYPRDSLRNSVSPDGKWLVYYTGTKKEEPYDVTLNIFHLPDGRTRPVARLLSEGFPENLQIAVKKVQERYPDFKDVEMLFPMTLRTDVFAWSPDSRYLAFASQIGGGSSDLYLYDMQSGETRRLTDDLLNVGYIEWSPDGSWIAFTNLTPENYTGRDLHSIRPDAQLTTESKIFQSGWGWYGNWISPNLYWISHQGDGGPSHFIEYLNVGTGKKVSVWPRTFCSNAIDPLNLLNIVSELDSPDDYGTFLVTANGQYTKLTDMVSCLDIVFRGSKPSRFLFFDGKQVLLASQDGSMIQLTDKPFDNASVSPDQRWFVLYHSSPDAHLYSENDQFARSYNQVGEVLSWRPDSAGFFFQKRNDLYYAPVPDGEPVLIDHCSSCDYSGLVWLP